MPFVKVDYELTVDEQFVAMQLVMFNQESMANLQNDRPAVVPPTFKSQPVNSFDEAYIVNPSNQFVKIFAVGTGNEGFDFTMTLTFTAVDQDLRPLSAPFSPAAPLRAVVNGAGIATLDQTVRWV
ncbi:hypothetical protein [Spirosoma endbachense]|uniref:Uncharacterized protein n=1 Tax=Spirosoma endbachense TaxID=2666025 RepID=A0A6P1W001_9BACT|nr:hypothetical protein [Spirosoma endbachense]QHV97898.1 hypothetical protein GJR95_24100 [Spirosoma endbachense]